jgi:hypothetical protein
MSTTQLELPAPENPVRHAGGRWFAGEQTLVRGPETPTGRPNGGRPTLEDRISRVWEGLHADGATECPVCHGRMHSRQGGGHCMDCGSTLT